jgi:hypothetical protein
MRRQKVEGCFASMHLVENDQALIALFLIKLDKHDNT